MTTNRTNRSFLLSAAACSLFFTAGIAAAKDEQPAQAPQAQQHATRGRRAPKAPQAQGGLVGALPGGTGQQQQATAIAPTAPPPPEAAVLPAPAEPAPQQGVVNAEAPVEMDMPLGDMALPDAEAALDREGQPAPQRGQLGQTGQSARAQGDQPLDLPGLDATAIPSQGGQELLPPGDEASSQAQSSQSTPAPEAKKPGFFRRMWTAIKTGVVKGSKTVAHWFHHDKKPAAEQASPSDAPLTDIDLSGQQIGD
jgi:hypothetical protein